MDLKNELMYQLEQDRDLQAVSLWCVLEGTLGFQEG